MTHHAGNYPNVFKITSPHLEEITSHWPAPSYIAVYAIVRGLRSRPGDARARGPKAYRERFDMLCRRETSRPNEIWLADHTPLDLWIRDVFCHGSRTHWSNSACSC